MCKFICEMWNKANEAFIYCFYTCCSEHRVSSAFLLGLDLLRDEIALRTDSISISQQNKIATAVVKWLATQKTHISLKDLKTKISSEVQIFYRNDLDQEDSKILDLDRVDEVPERKVNCGEKLVKCCSVSLMNDILMQAVKLLDDRINTILNKREEYEFSTQINHAKLKNYIIDQIINRSNLNKKIISDILNSSIEHFVVPTEQVEFTSFVIPTVPILIEEEKVEVGGSINNQDTEILL